MKESKRLKEKVYEKSLFGYALVLGLLLRPSFSRIFGIKRQDLDDQQVITLFRRAYLSEVKVSGAGSFKEEPDPKSVVPPPKDGSFAAFYQFREINVTNSTDLASFPRK